MHVLHVIDTLRPGGAQRVLIEIANQSSIQGIRISVCVTRDGLDMANRLQSVIPLMVLGRAQRFDWMALRRLAAFASDADIVHAHGRSSFSLVAFLKSCGMLRAPIVMHDHIGTVSDENPPLWFRGWAHRHVAQYVSVFEASDRWRESIRAESREVIPGALDLREFENPAPSSFAVRREFGVAAGELVGICLGGVRAEKGIHTLIQAVARSSRRMTLKIVVVGGVRDAEYWSRCTADVERLGLKDHILFAGERIDVRTWHAQFDFAVHAARRESGPLVVIEHLAAGLPLVCTRTGGIARRAEDLGVERFVDPDNPVALADALDELSTTPRHTLMQRSQAAREIARVHFDIRSVMPSWLAVYDRALTERSHRN